MSHDESPKLRDPHRFFHTMVLMGSALALGCGGISDPTADPHDDNGGSGGSGSGGSGGSATNRAGTGSGGTTAGGGTGTTGGTGTVGLGGTGTVGVTGGATSTATGGATSTATGGTSGTTQTGAAGAPPRPDCPMEQWACDSYVCTGDGQRYQIPNDCRCDETLPKSAADCGPDQSFVCHVGLGTRAGESPLSTFACTCADKQPDCNSTCHSVLGAPSECLADRSDSDTVLCGCALVLLK